MNEPAAIWYLYLVRCRDGSLYTGITTDVARRFSMHQGNGDAGAKYLRGRGPLTLAFQKEIGSRSLALKLENQVKKLPRGRKERLIAEPGYLEGMLKKAKDF